MPASVTVDTGLISYRLPPTDVNTDNREKHLNTTQVNGKKHSVGDKSF